MLNGRDFSEFCQDGFGHAAVHVDHGDGSNGPPFRMRSSKVNTDQSGCSGSEKKMRSSPALPFSTISRDSGISTVAASDTKRSRKKAKTIFPGTASSPKLGWET